MNYKIQKLKLSNKETILNILLILSAIWMLIGCFPLVCYESDSTNVIAGCEFMSTYFSLPPVLSYCWGIQPLTILSVFFFKKILFFLSCEQIYCGATIILTFLCIYLISLIVNFFTKRNIKIIALSLILFFPESYSILSYPNSAIFAFFFFLLPLYMFLKDKNKLIIILLLGIAPLFRADILMMYPILLLIAYIKKRKISKAVIITTIFAVTTISIYVISNLLLKANPLLKLSQKEDIASEVTKNILLKTTFEMSLTYFQITTFILIILGIYSIIKRKKWFLLSLSVIPVLINYFVYFDHVLYCGKYFLYMLPFIIIIVVEGLYYIKEKKKYLLTLLCLLGIEFFIGTSFSTDSLPWFSTSYSILNNKPKGYNIASINLNNKISIPIGKLKNLKANISIGPGQVIGTADELMLINGHFFSPFYYHLRKSIILKEREKALQYILKNTDTNIIVTAGYGARTMTLQLLLRNGFILKKIYKSSWEFEYPAGYKNKLITVKDAPDGKGDPACIKKISESEKTSFYLCTFYDWTSYYLQNSDINREKITDRFYLIHK